MDRTIKIDTMEDRDKKQLKVAIYIRVSTDDQAKNYGPEMQEDAIRSYIKSKGQFEDGRDRMVFAGKQHIYRDEGVSGTLNIEDRSEFSRLVENIKRSKVKPFDVVAVYKVDRFARRLKVLINIIDFFEKYKVQFLSVNESIDTSTPFGRAILGIMGVIAELELETIKIRTSDGKTKSIENGIYNAVPPYGYKKNVEKRLVKFETEAKYVRQIFELAVFENKNPKEIADYMMENKIISPDISSVKYKKRKGESKKKNPNTFWRSDTIRDIISKEIYVGKHYYNKTHKGKRLPKEKWKLSPFRHPRIIEDEMFYKAQEVLKASVNKTLMSRKKKDNRLYLLSGLLKCKYCSDDMNDMHSWNGDRKEVGKGTGNYSYYYKCGHKNTQKYAGTCPTIPIPAEQLEAYVISFAKNLLTNPQAAYDYQLKLRSTKLRKKHLETERSNLVKNINYSPQRIENLKEQQEHGHISTDELTEKLTTVEKEVMKWQERLKEVDRVLGKYELSVGYVKSFNQYAKKYSEALNDVFNNKQDIYKLLHSIIDKIIIHSRSFNPKFDRIPGRKKDNQQIPNAVEIKLKLPRSLMLELVKQQTKRFGVGTDTL